MALDQPGFAHNALRFGILVPFILLILSLGCCFWYAGRHRTYARALAAERLRERADVPEEAPELIEAWIKRGDDSRAWQDAKPLWAAHARDSDAPAPQPTPTRVRPWRVKDLASSTTMNPLPSEIQLAILVAMPCERERIPPDKLSEGLPLAERFGGSLEFGLVKMPWDGEGLE